MIMTKFTRQKISILPIKQNFMIKNVVIKIVVAVTGILMAASCANVKAYQKSRLNDSEMALSGRKIEKTDANFQSYREGSSGANGGKTGGGCGCN